MVWASSLILDAGLLRLVFEGIGVLVDILEEAFLDFVFDRVLGFVVVPCKLRDGFAVVLKLILGGGHRVDELVDFS